MNQQQLLAELFQRGVKVWADGDKLLVRAPKGALTPELRACLASQKQEIMSLVGSGTKPIPVPEAPLVAVSRNVNSPLSSSQERLWQLVQIHPDSPVYNLPKAMRLAGPLCVSALGRSVNEIVQRHEILRTTFPVVEGHPVQVISSDMQVELPAVDLRELHQSERSAAIQRLACEEIQQPFKLAQGPLLRVKLLQLGDEEHLLFVTAHHLVFDGWSFNVFCRELGTLYASFATGKPSALHVLSLQYADFAHWEQQMLQHEAMQGQLRYWKQQLGGAVTALELPLDRPRPRGRTSQGARQSLVLPANLTAALKARSQLEEISLFMLLLAAFQALLHGYTGQEDIIVCSPIAGRHRAETRQLIGYFSRLLPMRTDLAGNPSFREVLRRVRRMVSEAYENQDVPLQKLADFPNLVRTPLTRGMFLLQPPIQPPELPGLTASFMDVHNGAADFDLSLSMEETAATLTGVLEYRTDLFDEATVSQMGLDFQTLLEQITANPEWRVGETKRRAQPVLAQRKIETSPFIGPLNELERELTWIWEKVLAVQPIGVHDNFFDLGGHSLLAVRLCDRLEKSTGRPVPLTSLFQAPTIAQLASVLRDENGSPRWTALVPVREGGTRTPLFIVPPAGDTIRKFAHWARYFDSEQPVYGLQPLGFDKHETPHDSVEAMAAYYLADIRKRQPRGPYVLGGICFGAIVALEIAQQLHDQGEHIALVVIFDLGPPNRPDWNPQRGSRAVRVKRYWRQGILIKSLSTSLLHRFKVSIPLLPQLRRFRRVLNNHQKAYLAYRIKPYAGDIVLIQSEEGAAWEGIRTQWAALITGTSKFSYTVIPDASHAEIFDEYHAPQLIQQLTQILQTLDTADRRMNPP